MHFLLSILVVLSCRYSYAATFTKIKYLPNGQVGGYELIINNTEPFTESQLAEENVSKIVKQSSNVGSAFTRVDERVIGSNVFINVDSVLGKPLERKRVKYPVKTVVMAPGVRYVNGVQENVILKLAQIGPYAALIVPVKPGAERSDNNYEYFIPPEIRESVKAYIEIQEPPSSEQSTKQTGYPYAPSTTAENPTTSGISSYIDPYKTENYQEMKNDESYKYPGKSIIDNPTLNQRETAVDDNNQNNAFIIRVLDPADGDTNQRSMGEYPEHKDFFVPTGWDTLATETDGKLISNTNNKGSSPAETSSPSQFREEYSKGVSQHSYSAYPGASERYTKDGGISASQYSDSAASLSLISTTPTKKTETIPYVGLDSSSVSQSERLRGANIVADRSPSQNQQEYSDVAAPYDKTYSGKHQLSPGAHEDTPFLDLEAKTGSETKSAMGAGYQQFQRLPYSESEPEFRLKGGADASAQVLTNQKFDSFQPSHTPEMENPALPSLLKKPSHHFHNPTFMEVSNGQSTSELNLGQIKIGDSASTAAGSTQNYNQSPGSGQILEPFSSRGSAPNGESFTEEGYSSSEESALTSTESALQFQNVNNDASTDLHLGRLSGVSALYAASNSGQKFDRFQPGTGSDSGRHTDHEAEFASTDSDHIFTDSSKFEGFQQNGQILGGQSADFPSLSQKLKQYGQLNAQNIGNFGYEESASTAADSNQKLIQNHRTSGQNWRFATSPPRDLSEKFSDFPGIAAYGVSSAGTYSAQGIPTASEEQTKEQPSHDESLSARPDSSQQFNLFEVQNEGMLSGGNSAASVDSAETSNNFQEQNLERFFDHKVNAKQYTRLNDDVINAENVKTLANHPSLTSQLKFFSANGQTAAVLTSTGKSAKVELPFSAPVSYQPTGNILLPKLAVPLSTRTAISPIGTKTVVNPLANAPTFYEERGRESNPYLARQEYDGDGEGLIKGIQTGASSLTFGNSAGFGDVGQKIYSNFDIPSTLQDVRNKPQVNAFGEADVRTDQISDFRSSAASAAAAAAAVTAANDHFINFENTAIHDTEKQPALDSAELSEQRQDIYSEERKPDLDQSEFLAGANVAVNASYGGGQQLLPSKSNLQYKNRHGQVVVDDKEQNEGRSGSDSDWPIQIKSQMSDSKTSAFFVRNDGFLGPYKSASDSPVDFASSSLSEPSDVWVSTPSSKVKTPVSTSGESQKNEEIAVPKYFIPLPNRAGQPIKPSIAGYLPMNDQASSSQERLLTSPPGQKSHHPGVAVASPQPPSTLGPHTESLLRTLNGIINVPEQKSK